jgi:DNA processing protein
MDLLYQIALSQVPHIGYVHAKILIEHFGTAQSIFRAKMHELERLEGIGTVRAQSIHSFRDFSNAEKEIRFMEKYRIQPLFLKDPSYPQRLLHCYDPPTLLYYKGNADLNASRIIAIVGTRSNTEYGKQFTEKLVRDLSSIQVLVVSGLAFGIDACAHKAALKNSLQTVGALGHGLDTIYPSEHTALAKEMVKQGGLLTEFPSKTKPDKHNFPSRNRLVAGMCDAVVLVETGIKGGSMITGELAHGYNRDVFAVPGRTTDTKSAGCNYLIRSNKAILLTEAREIIDIMGWEETKKTSVKQQRTLFVELSDAEKTIVNILQEKENVSVDEINLKSGLSSSTIAAALLNLEIQNVVHAQPGKMYSLV